MFVSNLAITSLPILSLKNQKRIVCQTQRNETPLDKGFLVSFANQVLNTKQEILRHDIELLNQSIKMPLF